MERLGRQVRAELDVPRVGCGAGFVVCGAGFDVSGQWYMLDKLGRQARSAADEAIGVSDKAARSPSIIGIFICSSPGRRGSAPWLLSTPSLVCAQRRDYRIAQAAGRADVAMCFLRWRAGRDTHAWSARRCLGGGGVGGFGRGGGPGGGPGGFGLLAIHMSPRKAPSAFVPCRFCAMRRAARRAQLLSGPYSRHQQRVRDLSRSLRQGCKAKERRLRSPRTDQVVK